MQFIVGVMAPKVTRRELGSSAGGICVDLKERLCVVLALGSLAPSSSCLTFSLVRIPSLSWKRKTWCPDPFGLLLPPEQYSHDRTAVHNPVVIPKIPELLFGLTWYSWYFEYFTLIATDLLVLYFVQVFFLDFMPYSFAFLSFWIMLVFSLKICSFNPRTLIHQVSSRASSM